MNSIHNKTIENMLKFSISLISFVIIGFFIACSGNNEEKFNKLMSSAAEYSSQGKLQEARIQLQSAIDLKPKDAEAYYQLAEVMVRLGQLGVAVEYYNTSINYDPAHRLARLHLCSILIAGRQFELAESNLSKLLEKDPRDLDALILKAALQANGPRKDLQTARGILQDVLVRDPKNIAATASLGHIELADENNQRAEELFKKALELEPSAGPIKLSLADLYTRQGRLNEAQDILEDLVEDNKGQAGLHYVFGEFLLRRGLGEKALNQYIETVKSDLGRHDARDRLYDMYIVRKRLDDARALTQELIKERPDDSGTKYFRGRDAELANNKREALSLYMEAIKGLPNFAPIFRRTGLIEIALGDPRQGLEHLNQAVAIDPGDVGARLQLAKELFLQKDYVQAREHLDQILARYPQQLGANILKADIAMINGESESARLVYNFLIKAFPNYPLGYFKMGVLAEREEKNEEAIEWYKKTLAFDRNILGPARRMVALMAKRQGSTIKSIYNEVLSFQSKSKNSQPDYDLLLGSIKLADQEDTDRLELARKHFHKALEGNSDLVGAYFALGALDAAKGDIKAALNNYIALLEKNPEHIPTRMLLALSLEQLKNYPEAADQYRELLKISPRFGPAANNLAWLLSEELHGDLDEAVKLAEIAKEQLPKEASIADTLGWIYFRRGNPRAALPLIEEAIELHETYHSAEPLNPEIVYHLAEIKAALGEKGEAKAKIAEAIKLAGKDHPVYVKMKQLEASLK